MLTDAHAPSPAPLTERRHRFTREEVRFLMAACALREGTFELIEGDIVDKMPKNAPHVNCVRRTVRQLIGVFGEAFVRQQDPIVLSDSSEPEPDIVVTTFEESRYGTENPPASDVVLVVEVSAATLRYDLDVKAGLYARAGIPEYWVIDVGGRVLHRHRDPLDGLYQHRALLADTDRIAPGDAPAARLLVRDLLP